MNKDTQLTPTEAASVERPRHTETDAIYVPPVDISETTEAIRLRASVPGADRESTSVSIENNVLTIEAQSHAERAPEGYELVGQEYAAGKFRRRFTLSDQVNPDGIKARVTHGVLELTIPKQDASKTRNIEIET